MRTSELTSVVWDFRDRTALIRLSLKKGEGYLDRYKIANPLTSILSP